MTVQTEVSRSGPYAGAGTTGPFTVGFRFLADSHLRVIRTGALGIDTDLSLGTDYTVTGAGDDTGTVTLIAALPVGASLTIIRDVPFIQEADYVDNDAFPAESHEAALDLLTMQTQQIKEAQDRALALSPTADAGVSTELPVPIANNIIGWNPTGDGLQNLDPAALAGIISYGSYIVDVFDGDGVETEFVLSGSALVSANCDVVVDGVSQTPGINFDYAPGTQSVVFLTGAPPVGINNVVVRYGSALAAGVATAVTGQTATGTALITAADAADARTAIGAVQASDVAAKGANSDITSLSGLTTALTVAQGGTGVSTLAALRAAIGSESYIYIRDEKASGTASGGFTLGAWRTRTLNTKVNDAGSVATLASNQITLPAGTYRFKARCPAYVVDFHKCRLQNITDNISYYGSSAFANLTAAASNESFVSGRFTIASSKVFELQHISSATQSPNGFGQSSSLGVIEVYAEIEFWKEL